MKWQRMSMESFPDERKWPEIPAGEVQLQYEEHFFPGGVARPWKEFQPGGGCWSQCLWKWARVVCMWPLGARFRGAGGGARLAVGADDVAGPFPAGRWAGMQRRAPRHQVSPMAAASGLATRVPFAPGETQWGRCEAAGAGWARRDAARPGQRLRLPQAARQAAGRPPSPGPACCCWQRPLILRLRRQAGAAEQPPQRPQHPPEARGAFPVGSQLPTWGLGARLGG